MKDLRWELIYRDGQYEDGEEAWDDERHHYEVIPNWGAGSYSLIVYDVYVDGRYRMRFSSARDSYVNGEVEAISAAKWWCEENE